MYVREIIGLLIVAAKAIYLHNWSCMPSYSNVREQIRKAVFLGEYSFFPFYEVVRIRNRGRYNLLR